MTNEQPNEFLRQRANDADDKAWAASQAIKELRQSAAKAKREQGRWTELAEKIEEAANSTDDPVTLGKKLRAVFEEEGIPTSGAETRY